MFDIYLYTDFRKALSDFYTIEKEQKPQISHRYIAQKVGFKSSGFFSQILKGQSNISQDYIINFAKFMKLKKREAEYFETLVQFNQAKTHTIKKHFFEKLRTFSKARIKQVDAAHYEFYDNWYHTAIREVLDYYPFKDDYKELARMVLPAITSDEARRSIALLDKLGFIEKKRRGILYKG